MKDPIALLTAISDFYDESADDVSVGRHLLDTELSHLAWVILRDLDEPKRAKTYVQLFRKSSGISFLCRLLPDSRDKDDFIVSQASVAKAQKLFAKKVRAEGVGILDRKGASRILWIAQQWVAPDVPPLIGNAARRRPDVALRLLRAYVYRQLIDIGRPRKRHGDPALLPQVKEVVDLEALLGVIQRLRPEALTPDDRYAVELLKAAVTDAARARDAVVSTADADEAEPSVPALDD